MIIDQIKTLETAKAKVVELEQAIAAELRSSLATLPAQFGFDSVESFVAAVKAAAGVKRKKRGPNKANTKKSSARKSPGKKRRKRAVITDVTRGEVKKMVEAGKSGSEIASVLKISLPSVHNIKKALGLVKAKKKK